jgi:hypothetical protein
MPASKRATMVSSSGSQWNGRDQRTDGIDRDQLPRQRWGNSQAGTDLRPQACRQGLGQHRFLLLILSSTFLQGYSFVASKLVLPASTGAMGLWFAALQTGGAVRTSGFLFLCPLFAAAINFVINGEILSLHEVTGGIMIAAGIVLLSRTSVSQRASHEALPSPGQR